MNVFIRNFSKVHIFWEGHKILRNLHLTFDYSTYSQKLGEDFATFCGLLRIYELYMIGRHQQIEIYCYNRVDKEGSRLERTLDFDSFDLGVNF